MSTPPLVYSNHFGLFRYHSSICYCEYAGQDILFRHQFKVISWLGALAADSWSGHQAWDFDDALFFEFGGVWHFRSIFDGTRDEDGETVSEGSRFIPYGEEHRPRLSPEGAHGLDLDITPEQLLDTFFLIESENISLIDPQTPAVDLAGPEAETIDPSNTPKDCLTVFAEKIEELGCLRRD
jgi:hypothetical protein